MSVTNFKRSSITNASQQTMPSKKKRLVDLCTYSVILFLLLFRNSSVSVRETDGYKYHKGRRVD